MSDGNSKDDWNYTEAVGTRLSHQTKEQFDQYKEKNNLGNAEALRRLTRQALEGPDREPIRLASFIAATLFIIFSFGTEGLRAEYIIGGTYIAGTFLWAFWPDLTGLLDSLR